MQEQHSGQYINYLADKIARGEHTPEELEIYEQWWNAREKNETEADSDSFEEVAALGERIFAGILAKVPDAGSTPQGRSFSPAGWIWAAAAVVIMVAGSIAVLTYVKKDNKDIAIPFAYTGFDVSAGKDKAVLTRAGRTIDLTSAGLGKLNIGEGLLASKTKQGMLDLSAANPSAQPAQYATIQTPRGGQFQVKLEDGTVVWLNAATTLEFPDHFVKGERVVKVVGEAFFDVAADASRPFRVITANQQITVLGTRFNVAAYPEDAVTTTTLESGSVKVKTTVAERIIRPEEETKVTPDGTLDIGKADMFTSLAWVNGMTAFKSISLQQLLKQVSRWYNIEVQFEGQPSADTYSGGISRKSNLSALIGILKAQHINCRLQPGSGGKQPILIITGTR